MIEQTLDRLRPTTRETDILAMLPENGIRDIFCSHFIP